jgi:putative hydroxymethylpyrimidine transport system permease protein
MTVARPILVCFGLLVVWQALVWATSVPPFILPGPDRVLQALVANASILVAHAGVTLTEMLLGLLLGTALGLMSALTLAYVRPIRPWLLPVLVVSQAIPVFALAPVLVLWLGYGMASKVAMASLIIFFPVTGSFYDGLRRTEPGWLELARTMDATPASILWRVQVPAALPALASGLRVAAAVVPIGAVVGEWVGASAGLGYLMLHANGRMQIDLMFAALFVLALMALGFYFLLDAALGRWISWQAEDDEWRDSETART